jgi:hypothetical protein
VTQSYRFAAADGATRLIGPEAVSWVMAGGVFAGVLGPQLVQWTMDIWQPYLFAFNFVAQAGVALGAMALLSRVNAPKPAVADLPGGRPLGEIARQPRFIAAAICGIVSYSMMNLVMTSAPLAMRICGLSLSDSNFGIQWHIVAMYGPSFFTGSLIARFGGANCGGRNSGYGSIGKIKEFRCARLHQTSPVHGVRECVIVNVTRPKWRRRISASRVAE